MTKRKQKLTPEQRITVAGYHDRAYGAGRFFAIHMLETIVGMKRARTGDFEGIDRSRFQPDMFFIRGFLDATRPVFGDAGSLMRSKFGQALQEAILDDFFDNAEAALQKIKGQHFDRMPSF